MKITGELLKAERIKQDLKISDVSFALKLSNKVIQCIESGDEDALPAKTFVRGFVKSYAEYLKLDSAVVLKQFQEEMGSTSPVPKSPPPMPQSNLKKSPLPKESEPVTVLNEKINSGFTQKHILIFICVSLFVVVFAAINHFVNKYATERVESVVAGNQMPNSGTVTTPNDQQSVQQPDMSQTVPKSTDITFATESHTEARPESVPLGGAIGNQNTTVQYAANLPSSGKPVEVVIEAKKDVTIQYAKGNSSTFEKIFIKENSYQVIRSAAGLHLRTEDGSNIILTVNGVIKNIDKSKPMQLAF